jgi:hypothetical protein
MMGGRMIREGGGVEPVANARHSWRWWSVLDLDFGEYLSGTPARGSGCPLMMPVGWDQIWEIEHDPDPKNRATAEPPGGTT